MKQLLWLRSTSIVSVTIAALSASSTTAAAMPQTVSQQKPSEGPDAAPDSAKTLEISDNSLNGDAAGAQAGEAAGDNDIVVTGVRASLQQALAIKRAAPQIVESVVAENVGKLPDNNVIEALQRVTGVQVTDRTQGEVRTISIRGLTDVTTTLNGRNIFTASGRQFSLADVPANLVRRIDVYKTRAAEQLETGIAGQIDVFTRRPFDFKGLAVSAVARGIYQEQADSFNPNISALVSNRWNTGIGDVGVLVNLSYSRTRYRDQGLTAGAEVPFVAASGVPAGWSALERVPQFDTRAPGQTIWQPGLNAGLPRAAGSAFSLTRADGSTYRLPYLLARDAVFQFDLDGVRKRPAANIALQWAPNAGSEYTAEFFYAGYRQDLSTSLFFTLIDNYRALGANPGSTIALYPNSNVVSGRTVNNAYNFTSGEFNGSKSDSFVYSLSGKWEVGDHLKLKADGTYQTSQFDTQFLAARAERTAARQETVYNVGNGLPSFTFPDGPAVTDPSIWTLAQFYDNANRNKGDAKTVQGDGDYEFVDGFVRKISFGARYDDRISTQARRTQTSDSLGATLSSLRSNALFGNKNFLDGRANVPASWTAVDGFWLSDNTTAYRDLYKAKFPAFRTTSELSLLRDFRVKEVTTAAYLQGDFEVLVLGRPLQLETGVRFVDVKTSMDFTDFQTLLISGAEKHVSTFLPSATLNFDLTDKLRLRFNYGKTLRRPNFTDLNPNFTLVGDLTQVGYGQGSGGNPDLDPTTSSNFDLAAEWYFDRDSAIYATLFRRDIKGLVVPFRSVRTIPNSGLNTTTFIISQPANASEGWLKGLEVGLTYFPKYLPGILNGLGVNGSLTVLDSSQTIPQTDSAGRVVGEQKTDFFGVSKFSYNATLAYDRGPVGARLSYVWRKAFLNGNEAALFANPIGIWRRPEKSLDFQLTYEVSKRAALTLDATNITDTLQQQYYRFGSVGDQDTTNFSNNIIGRSVAIGFRYSLD